MPESLPKAPIHHRLFSLFSGSAAGYGVFEALSKVTAASTPKSLIALSAGLTTGWLTHTFVKQALVFHDPQSSICKETKEIVDMMSNGEFDKMQKQADDYFKETIKQGNDACKQLQEDIRHRYSMMDLFSEAAATEACKIKEELKQGHIPEQDSFNKLYSLINAIETTGTMSDADLEQFETKLKSRLNAEENENQPSGMN